MLFGNVPVPIPPDGYVDNPNEVNELLSKNRLQLNYRDVRNLAVVPSQKLVGPSPSTSTASSASASASASAQVDNLLSRELFQLSLQDRNAINEEIHGVQTFAPEETPEMLSSALRDLQAEINLISSTSKVAFDRSQEFSYSNTGSTSTSTTNTNTNTYINSAEFRLRFLRCDLFDAKKAASRMVKFLDILSEVFGDFALRRQVQMSDFSREEIQLFRVGYQQLLPYRDRSGRRIFASVGGFGLKAALVSRVKILIYIILAASEDVETQRKGITSIIWPGKKIPAGDDTGNVKVDRVIFMKRVYESLPVRTCSLHFCIPDTPFFKVLRTIFILSMPPYLLQRMKFHVGENVELQYSVKGFGIPVELIPLTDTGNIKTTYLKQWMKVRKTYEVMRMTEQHHQRGASDNKCDNNDDNNNNNNVLSIIECPGSNDVVFRSGTSMSCHPGNVRFRCLVESKHDNNNDEINSTSSPAFIVSSRTTQAELAEQLIEEVEVVGGRFLKWDNAGYWTEIIDRLQIHTKVALSIRDYKYKTKAQRNQQKNRQTNHSYTYLFQCQDGNKRKRTNNNNNGNGPQQQQQHPSVDTDSSMY